MEEVSMEDDLQDFLKFWFAGFISELEKVDGGSREVILKSCGVACAQSYTEQVFCEARQKSSDLRSFLVELAERFPGASYEIAGEKLYVRYGDCACDLVREGYVNSPLLCQCSVSNLKQNFEKTLERSVTVSLISSILGGAKECNFEVEFGV